SWAVPKGPSLNPEDRRLAVLVEDHPLEYGSFEGIIPQGNYGAGTVMVWDTGTYHVRGMTSRAASEQAMHEGLAKGSLKLVLDGDKLHGEFALFKIRGTDEKNWLLIKKQDDGASVQPIPDDDISALSSRTMAQIASNTATPKRNRLQRIDLRGVPKGPMPT